MNDLSIRRAEFEDWSFLLSLRNDPETRNNSHNTSIVEEIDHKDWLKSTLDNKNRFLYICEYNGEKCGYVRCDFDEDENSYELSWAVSPLFRGKGIGVSMVKACIEVMDLKRIKSEVKVGNIPSIRISTSLGMELKKTEAGISYFSNF